ncbi:unnamed protein product [Parnassius mnemosyne]|uniref:Uncharacterized protein n=1 Tax=Parnassius mnemosyne TaxID=213953 RepID=A0AAV1KZE6_9NEOP
MYLINTLWLKVSYYFLALSSEQIQSALEFGDDDSIIEGISDDEDLISLTAHAETLQEGEESSTAAGWLLYRKEAQMLETPKNHTGLFGVQS